MKKHLSKSQKIEIGILLSFAAMAAIVLVGLLGAWVGQVGLLVIQAPLFWAGAAILGTVALGGYVASLTKTMPNYIGRPSPSDLRRALKAPATALILALAVAGCVAPVHLSASNEALRWMFIAVVVVNAGFTVMAILAGCSLVRDYQRLCDEYDSTPEHQRGW